MKKALNIIEIILQIVLVVAISIIGSLLQKWLHIPLAGSIIGMILFYILLHFQIIRVEWVSKGADFLLTTMVFFFIPSVVGIMDIVSNITTSYIIFFLLIIIGTSCVALVSGFIAETK